MKYNTNVGKQTHDHLLMSHSGCDAVKHLYDPNTLKLNGGDLNALRDGPLKELTVDTSAKQKFISQFILCRWEMGRKETGALLGEPAEPACTWSTVAQHSPTVRG